MKHIYKKSWLLLLFALPTFLNFADTEASKSKIRFVKNNLEQVKNKAAAENKPFFVDFTASWCMPCRWMEETTFTDPKLTEYVNRNYLAVKVDVDDFEGYNYKEQYNITMLPSIMIFSPEGEVLARYQESMSPSKLLKELQRYHTYSPTDSYAANTETYVEEEFQGPDIYDIIELEEDDEDEVMEHYISPVNHAKPINVSPRPQSQPAVQSAPTYTLSPLSEQSTTSESPVYNPPPRPTTRPAATGDGLYRLSVARQLSEGFSVQTGAYSDYQNVLREVDRLQSKFDQPVIVHVEAFDGLRMYKILLGEFETRGAAENYSKAISYQQVVGYVQDMSRMK